ncbi:unnamed protein product [Linum trigynum]|uniref:Uncharacterized protein n=1 Tax=Linum trigynum TaxID=586398 RepID=A0AAV2EUH8_9ROSI
MEWNRCWSAPEATYFTRISSSPQTKTAAFATWTSAPAPPKRDMPINQRVEHSSTEDLVEANRIKQSTIKAITCSAASWLPTIWATRISHHPLSSPSFQFTILTILASNRRHHLSPSMPPPGGSWRNPSSCLASESLSLSPSNDKDLEDE